MVTKTRTPDPEDIDAKLAQVQMVDDPLEYMMCCVLALAPGLSHEVAKAALQHAREQQGGRARWIASGADESRRRRNAAILRDHHAGERIPLLMRRYGLTRSQIHRILSASE